MHIYFSGIGGTGLGPLSIIASQAGYDVSGSDKQHSLYIDYLASKGVSSVNIDQSYEAIAAAHAANPIDWFVYTTAVTSEQADPPELRFCKEHGIRMSLRDELLNQILEDKSLSLIAIAGTHGKTTTTAMAIWLMKQLEIPVSYSVGAKIPFGDMGHYEPESTYFIYEADEYARNFLAFHPHTALITGVDWDHPDIYPTRDEYEDAFRKFMSQCERAVIWESDQDKLQLAESETIAVLNDENYGILNKFSMPGLVNRRNAWQVVKAIAPLTDEPFDKLVEIMNAFPGLSRRFEKLSDNLYTDYAHTPPKIRGALQTAEEVSPGKVVVVYEGLHNTRQHFIKDELRTLFDDVKQLYVVPSYLAREDPNLALLSPEDLRNMLSDTSASKTTPAKLDENLKSFITNHINSGDLVLCLTAGGGGSLDEWLRANFN